MRILIQQRSDVPIYQQIYEQVKEAILSRQLQDGDLLPSIRQLARELKVSVITTTRAYTDLEKDGYIAIVQGKGCYVNPIDQIELENVLLQQIEEHFMEIQKDAMLLNKSKIELFTLLERLYKEEV